MNSARSLWSMRMETCSFEMCPELSSIMLHFATTSFLTKNRMKAFWGRLEQDRNKDKQIERWNLSRKRHTESRSRVYVCVCKCVCAEQKYYTHTYTNTPPSLRPPPPAPWTFPSISRYRHIETRENADRGIIYTRVRLERCWCLWLWSWDSQSLLCSNLDVKRDWWRKIRKHTKTRHRGYL